ncbi:MAG TPA: efflux RND transporter periplasmic adaptor subunit [Candidatus Acidoferrales bacterium]|nr:efflux RND transporter periplasmic adaptor subunit [Candidatus Acidoferrales bacterium]
MTSRNLRKTTRKNCFWCAAALLISFAVPAFLITGCSHGASDDQESQPQLTAEVTLTKVVRGDIKQVAALNGNVIALPNQDVKLSALVAGRISALNVAEGDRVHKGEVLAEIDSRTYAEQLQQAQAALAQAKASLQNAQQSLARNETLFQRGIVARKDLEDARTQASVAEAAQTQAEAGEESAKLQMERTQVISPLDGVVAKRYASVGEQVDGTGAQLIAEVANINEVDLTANLPAAYLSKVHVGETIPISSDALPGKTFTGRVTAISPSVDPSTNVGSIRIRIANPGGVLRLGMYLTAQVALETHPNALTVPVEAVYHDESGQTQVYEVTGDTAKAADVKIGIESNGRAEILDGVKAGDTIIQTGGYGLGDTAKIKVKQ